MLESVFEKLWAVEYDQLPKPVQRVYLAPPLLSVPVEADGDGFRLLSPAGLDRPAPQALVPKLGIKTWRDGGGLGIIYQGVNMRRLVERLLRQPTRQQRLVARAWAQTARPLRLHLSPYVDFSEASEARFLVGGGACRRLSLCLRGSSAAALPAALPSLHTLATQISAHLPPRRYIMELAYFPSGLTRLVEINPALSLPELAAANLI